ncbi:SusC/RagA family TonB-linked outer membrane protein (plasmid) [Fulvitalea axinellae]|uniref:SusC/RagA family TonB-linked outer membrane protein n=1 Tax=Fulvitalea axinellae TaxID=1182444 RepID=A0AAU9CV85_9BACT|nr:SusC/RagA family TonB-linked outer membrane protein [Fulvitalea axinellae]
MKKHLGIYTILWALLSLPALGQKGTLVQGYVKDKLSGEALPGANVIEVDSENRFLQGVPTDLNGFYMLKLSSDNAKIRITYVGFKTQLIDVNGRSKINITLEDDSQLQTVVVQEERYTSDGIIAIRDKVSAISQVKLDDLDAMGVASVDQMLQGNISGVDITALGGDPGAGMQIRIRGTATITGDREPLIVLDGMPYDVDIDNSFDFNAADQRDFGALLSISPEDIESIEILKDAASAAIWGSRAANGVIQIKTRRGRKMKPQLRYNFKGSVEQQPDAIPMLSGADYAILQKDARFVAGQKGEFRELNFDKDWELYHNYSQDTDWLDAITQLGANQTHNLSLAGGGEKAKYRVAADYFNQQGTTVGTGLDRISFRANLDYDVSNRLRISTDFAYTRSDNDRTFYGDERAIAYRVMPNMSIYERDTLGNLTGRYFLDDRPNVYQETRKTNENGIYNPVAVIDKGRHKYLENRLRSVFKLNYQMTDYLLLQSSISYDLVNGRTDKFLPAEASTSSWSESGTNFSAEGSSENFSVRTMTKLIYTPNLGVDHDLMVMGQWETTNSDGSTYSAQGGALPSGEFNDPGVAGVISGMGSSTSIGRAMGGLVRTHYKYKDRYIFGGGVRTDASSQFGDGTRWGMFPFASAGWRISEEDFLSEVSWLNELKFRGGFGVNGNPPRGFGHYSIYKTTTPYLGYGGIAPANAKLKNLSWERTYQYNAGVDFHALDNRLHVEMDVYRKETTGLLWDLGTPSSSGVDKIVQNQGGMRNQGIELALRGTPYRDDKWRIDLDFNIAHNVNSVVEVPETFTPESGDMLKNGNYAVRVTKGDPLGGFYGYRFKGVFKDLDAVKAYDKDGNVIIDPNTDKPLRMLMGGSNYAFTAGDAIYDDINHDGVIDESDVVYLGSSNPDYTGGFGFRVSYKGLSVSSRFHYRVGQDIVNRARMNAENMFNRNNQGAATMRRWRFSGDETDMPRAIYDKGFNWLGSDRFVEEGSYLRWKNLSINYRFDRELIKRLNFKDLSVFFTAYNLYTFTDYTGQDPEVPLGADPFFFGVDNSTTPPSRTYTLGLTVIF